MSNSSMSINTDNKTSSFTVNLPQKITLCGKWSVALSEIHYNYNFFNITSGNNRIIFEMVPTTVNDPNNTITKRLIKNVSIKPGFYPNIEAVVSTINDEIKKTIDTNETFFSYNKFNGRTIISPLPIISNKIVSITFDPRLAMQLGFHPHDNAVIHPISPHPANIHFGIADQMLIYTDIIEPTYIGHEKAYVLKIVNTQPRSLTFGDACYKEFPMMHYMPLQKREFESISIDIRDYSGEYMPFLHGILTLKLHFKKQDG